MKTKSKHAKAKERALRARKRRIALETKRGFTHISAEVLEDFFHELPEDVIIYEFHSQIKPYDQGSFITAKLARPAVGDYGEVDDYYYGIFIKRWDKSGKLIKEKKDYEWETVGPRRYL